MWTKTYLGKPPKGKLRKAGQSIANRELQDLRIIPGVDSEADTEELRNHEYTLKIKV